MDSLAVYDLQDIRLECLKMAINVAEARNPIDIIIERAKQFESYVLAPEKKKTGRPKKK